MSLSWTSTGLYAYLADDHLAVARVQGGFTPVLSGIEHFPFAEGELPQAISALGLKWSGTAAVKRAGIVLGSRWVRYLVLPWNRDLVRHEFREKMAAALFERQYQQPVSGYRAMFGSSAYGQPLLVAYVQTSLLSTLTEGLQQQGIALKSTQPLLAAVWNHHYPELRKQSGTLLIREPHRLLRVEHQAGHVKSVSLRPMEDQDLPSVLSLLEGSVQLVSTLQTGAGIPGVQEIWRRPIKSTAFNSGHEMTYALYGVA